MSGMSPKARESPNKGVKGFRAVNLFSGSHWNDGYGPGLRSFPRRGGYAHHPRHIAAQGLALSKPASNSGSPMPARTP